jgi:hypothetical protein
MVAARPLWALVTTIPVASTGSGGPDGFETVLHMIEQAADGLVDDLLRTQS